MTAATTKTNRNADNPNLYIPLDTPIPNYIFNRQLHTRTKADYRMFQYRNIINAIMKVIGINGSARKDWNTATLVKKALEGAASAGE